MHSSTLAFFAIDAIKASWTTLLFFNREAENRTCKYELIEDTHAQIIIKYEFVLEEHTAHLVRFCC
jgi:hypothetical protein